MQHGSSTEGDQLPNAAGSGPRGFAERSGSVVGRQPPRALSASNLLAKVRELLNRPGSVAAEKPRRGDFEAEFIAKAWRDPKYKEALLNDPRAVFEDELGIEVPRDLNIRVLEEDENTLYLVLPRNPNEYTDKELDAEQLSLLAAGVRFDTPCAIPSSAAPAWFVELGFSPRTRDVSPGNGHR